MASRMNEQPEKLTLWIRQLASELSSMQAEMRAAMPPSAAIVSEQVHFPLIFTMLSLTHYPHPDPAFRFLLGASLVGLFQSSGLPSRHIARGELFDERMRKLAPDCRRCEKYVTDTFYKEAAIKNHLV